MVATLRVPLVFPVETCYESTKAIHSPRSGLKIGDHSTQIPYYVRVCPWGLKMVVIPGTSRRDVKPRPASRQSYVESSLINVKV